MTVEDPFRELPTASFEPAKKNGQRVLVVHWAEGKAHLRAELVRVGDVPTLLSVTIQNPRGLPEDQRTVPTEARVLKIVRAMEQEAWPYLLYFMDDTLVHDGRLSEVNEDVINTNLDRYQETLFKRPHARRPELVDVAMELVQKGTRTRDIINALVLRGASEATAYRRLKSARQALGFRV